MSFQPSIITGTLFPTATKIQQPYQGDSSPPPPLENSKRVSFDPNVETRLFRAVNSDRMPLNSRELKGILQDRNIRGIKQKDEADLTISERRTFFNFKKQFAEDHGLLVLEQHQSRASTAELAELQRRYLKIDQKKTRRTNK
jgi:hypothetical protein